MNEYDLRTILQEALLLYMDEPPNAIIDLQTFREAGVLSTNEGLVVSTQDSSQYQITIVKSK